MKNNDALFFVNLLQLAIYLKYGDEDFFKEIRSYRYGGTTDYLDGAAFVGLQQALEFLSEVCKSDYFKDVEFVKNLKINPLLRKLSINNDILNKLELPQCNLNGVPEGMRIRADQHYFEFETSALFMSQVVFAMDRIILKQSHITKDTQEFIRRLTAITESSGGIPQIFNQGSIKQYNTTESAYFARARELGGCPRFIGAPLSSAHHEIGDSINLDSWHLKSIEVVKAVNSELNKSVLRTVTSDFSILIENGIYYLTDEQYLGHSLLSFSLSGDLENSVSSSAKSSKGISVLASNSEGRFIDSYYQAIFSTSFLASQGLYGVNGIYRYLPRGLDSYQESSFRVKRNKVPQYKVDNIETLLEIVSQFKNSMESGRNVYFRGQGKHHSLNRHPKINILLYGNEIVNELSLPTSASREGFDFDTFYARLQLHIHAMMYADISAEEFEELFEHWKIWSHYPPCLNEKIINQNEKWFKLYYSYEWDLMIMALAQHYGVPTHGLDITTDLNVAIWFALNKWYSYQEEGREYCWYKTVEREEKNDICDYPVIYLVATDENLKHDLDQVEFSGLQALRPERQKANLHYGGWGLHTNICGEDVVAAIHLGAKFKPEKLFATEYLFPDLESDSFYKQLLLLKEAALKEGLIEGFSKIWEYKKENIT